MDKINYKNYAVFIITYKRPDKQLTLNMLKSNGFKGKIYLIVEETDPTLKDYLKQYKDSVLTFKRSDYADKFDRMINEPDSGSVCVRNAAFSLAKKKGLDYFVVLDDDYPSFYLTVDENLFYKNTKVTNFDKLFKIYLKYLHTSNIRVLALAQGGDFVGGEFGGFNRNDLVPLRKAMNCFFMRTSTPVQFNGALNEDSVMGLQEAVKGNVVLTVLLTKVLPITSQKAAGGLTEAYRDLGTYQKSFYNVMASPSSSTVRYQRAVSRVHHYIDGTYAYPRIIPESTKKR